LPYDLPAAGAGDGCPMFCMMGQPQTMTTVKNAHNKPI
jgi:hypothetical protein